MDIFYCFFHYPKTHSIKTNRQEIKKGWPFPMHVRSQRNFNKSQDVKFDISKYGTVKLHNVESDMCACVCVHTIFLHVPLTGECIFRNAALTTGNTKHQTYLSRYRDRTCFYWPFKVGCCMCHFCSDMAI